MFLSFSHTHIPSCMLIQVREGWLVCLRRGWLLVWWWKQVAYKGGKEAVLHIIPPLRLPASDATLSNIVQLDNVMVTTRIIGSPFHEHTTVLCLKLLSLRTLTVLSPVPVDWKSDHSNSCIKTKTIQGLQVASSSCPSLSAWQAGRGFSS